MVKRLFSTDALVLIAVLLLFAGLSYQTAQQAKPAKDDADHPRRTTHSAQPGGWKAWSLLLSQRGLTVKPVEKAPVDWDKASADVVICGPVWEGSVFSGEGLQNGWAKNEADAALKWVENGGVLVMATDTNNDITDKTGMVLEEDPSLPSSRVSSPAIPAQPAAFLAAVEKLAAPNKPYLARVAKSAPVLLTRGDKTIMAGRARGKGMVFVLSAPGIFDNAHLSKDDNARFAVQIVEAFARSPKAGQNAPVVLFDEYHQGYRETDGLWEAIGPAGRLAALQLGALALLVAYVAGSRFGLPIPLPPASRVSSEYVTSLADLYRRARAYDAVLDGVYQPFWRDLCKALGVPTDTQTSDVIRRASAALAPAGTSASAVEARLTALVRECQEKIAGGANALKEADLLRLAQSLSEMRKELTI